MSDYKINEAFNPNKVFMISSKELNKRLDPFFYIPSLVELENKVKEKNPKPLRDYVLSVSSGATPKTTEAEKYYSDKENGIPFLRVQNLSQYGFLQLDDCKYINKETHENYLKRSQVGEGDLLIKITGVGRMAVASVASDGFVGNCNQHLVVIKTGSKEISTIIAAYLNTDIGEKLASKRAAGGTRPAIDYTALLSIPILYNEQILAITKKAVETKTQKEQQAQKLLDSIDDYLLAELGIVLPPKNNSLENRIFTTSFNKISGSRFDPNHIGKIEYLLNQKWKFSLIELKEVIVGSPQYGANEEASVGDIETDIRYIRITDIDDYGNLKNRGWKTANKVEEKYLLNYNDLLFARSGSVGRCYIHKNIQNAAIFAGYLIRFVINSNLIEPDFVFFYCNSSVYKFWVSAIERQAVQSNINAEEYKSLKIPLPPKEKQKEIIENIQIIRANAKQLQNEAVEAFEIAKKQVEQLLLGN